MEAKSNWAITVYDGDDKIIDLWTIEDRTEHEAGREAMADIAKMENTGDWTMTPTRSTKMEITIGETKHEVESVYDACYLPEITLHNGCECIIAINSETAGQAARSYWKDMAENDPGEFARLVGQETLVAWALGQWAGPGSTKVTSLEKWLDLWLDTPEEQWGAWDGTKRDAHIEPGSALAEELGFEWDETGAYAGNCVVYLQNKEIG